MANTASTAWYRQGTVSVADGSTEVTGNGTRFLLAGINQGLLSGLTASLAYGKSKAL